jgi:hypothetical protein
MKKLLRIWIVLIFVGLAGACSSANRAADSSAAAEDGSQTGPAEIQDLNGVAALKGHFNQDLGKPRLVLLLSPT